MEKIINPGTTEDGLLWMSIKYEEKKRGRVLSITGVEGPRSNGDCRGSCGQVSDRLGAIIGYAPGYSPELCEKIRATWERWHLNDMRPGCEHQRDWNTAAPVVRSRFKWGPKYHELRRAIEKATDPNKAEGLARKICEVNAVFEAIGLHGYTTRGAHTWPAAAHDLLREGYIETDSEIQSSAGWTRPDEHPAGLLTRPCPVCGYEYGSAWNFEEVPQEVIDFLFSLPESTLAPAWV